MCEVAAAHGGTVIDDIVPGHTGKGADFRLAEMNVGDYPGIYHMVEIPPAGLGVAARGPRRPGLGQPGRRDRGPAGAGRVHHRPAAAGDLPRSGDQGHQLERDRAGDGPDGVLAPLGLPALLQGWSALDQLAGPDIRRHAAGGRGRAALARPPGRRRATARRQRVPRPRADRRSGEPAWSEGHPLSDAANQLIASMVRKVGGFTFQELNLAIEDIKRTSEHGADLSYDFVNRPAYVHALTTGDTEFLRLTLNAGARPGRPTDSARPRPAEPRRDDLRADPLRHPHQDDRFRFRGDDRAAASSPTDPTGAHRRADRPRGAVQRDLHHQRHRLHPGHDLRRRAGLPDLPICIASRSSRSSRPTCCSPCSTPAARCLRPVRLGPVRDAHVGPRASQLSRPATPDGSIARLRPDGLPAGRHRIARHAARAQPLRPAPDSWRTRLLRLAAAPHPRDPHAFGLATANQVDVPPVSHKGMLVMVHALSDGPTHQVTVLNFAQEDVTGTVRSERLYRARSSTWRPATTSERSTT